MWQGIINIKLFPTGFPYTAFNLQYGESPLLAACSTSCEEEGDIEIVDCLVEKGADVNKCDEVY